MNLTCASQIYRIRSAIAGNRLVYWLGRVPLLKRIFTDKLYAATEGKLVLCLGHEGVMTAPLAPVMFPAAFVPPDTSTALATSVAACEGAFKMEG